MNSLRFEILNALVDDGESIVQIEKYLEFAFDRQIIKEMIIILLNEALIKIAYPPKNSIIDFVKSNDITIEKFWFELTNKGFIEWQKSNSL